MLSRYDGPNTTTHLVQMIVESKKPTQRITLMPAVEVDCQAEEAHVDRRAIRAN